jgi:hypothetical protein
VKNDFILQHNANNYQNQNSARNENKTSNGAVVSQQVV